MKDDVYKNLSKQHSTRFGEIAVDMGFVTEKQLKEALVDKLKIIFLTTPTDS